VGSTLGCGRWHAVAVVVALVGLIHPAIGANECNAVDEDFWRTGGGFFQFDSKFSNLYRIAAWEPFDATKRAQIEFSASYSQECYTCFRDYALCLAEYCVDECGKCDLGTICGSSAPAACNPNCIGWDDSSLYDSNGCNTCRNSNFNGTNCRAEAEVCAGFGLSICNGCTNPGGEQDLTWIVVGSIAGIILVFGGAYFYWYKSTALKALPDVDEGLNEWQKPKKKGRGSITLDGTPTRSAPPVAYGQPAPNLVTATQGQDDMMNDLGYFPVVEQSASSNAPPPQPAPVNNAAALPPDAEFRVNRSHFHKPNQLMENPETYGSTQVNNTNIDDESDDDSVPQF